MEQTTTQQETQQKEVVKLLNLKQVALYIKNGAKPIDVFVSDDKLIFVFRAKETTHLWERWKNYNLN